MAFEDTDRRRSLLLGVVTLIALPAIYLVTRSDDSTGAGDTAAVVSVDGSTPAGASDGEPDGVSNRPPISLSDENPVFLDGPARDDQPSVNEIAVPARPENAPLVLSASFRSTVAGVRTCLVRDVAAGLSVTIKNLDNGRTISCVTSAGSDSQTADVVLHTDAFEMLADPTDAPITVELTQ